MGLRPANERVLLLHNPGCSKSRTARTILVERGADFEERRYLDQPLTPPELKELEALLGLPVRDWIRAGEPAYRELGLSRNSTDAELIDAIGKNPVLLQRPIIIRGDRAIVGRPPNQLLDLFEDD